MHFSRAALLAAATATNAQRPTDTPICDYYTTALLKNNTADNQATLLTLIVNTVVIGNYTTPNVGVQVPGILAPGQYMGEDVNLLPYFNGGLASSNRGGSSGVSVNFLDDGGAEPLMNNKPANTNSSKQYFLLTHLYQFFGSLLGCSMQGMAGFDAYTGHASMYDVHKFMDLDSAEVGYFINQVALAAASFGVAQDDISAVGTALTSLFDVRCAPPTTAIMAQGPQLQSICIAEDCPLAPNSTCSSYEPAVEPVSASSSMLATASSTPNPEGNSTTATSSTTSASPMYPTVSGTTTANATSSMTSSSPTMVATAGAATNGLGIAAAAAGLAALLL
ncbi:hypothetical protein F5B20DRAFT_583502 [Whalleya microplaca]|nr:hypothetical protein F5B20DRAFT_583502 [Whalleya microplaca]